MNDHDKLRALAELPAKMRAKAALHGQASQSEYDHEAGAADALDFCADELEAALAALGGKGEDCHCATCTCNPGMTRAIRFDVSNAEREGVIREHLISMGWTPPTQPEAQGEAVAPLDASMPERIWLQVDTDANNDERDEPFTGYLSDLTWCAEQIGGLEVEYVRADLRTAAPKPGEGVKLWLWKHYDHFLAFEHEYPCFTPGGDPMTLGPPAGYALFHVSHDRITAAQQQGDADGR